MRTPPYDEAPGRGQAFEGSIETVRWTANVTQVPQNTNTVNVSPPQPTDQLIAFLRRTFGLSASGAKVIAELHFGGAS